MKKYTLYWTAPVAIKLEGEPIFVEGPLHAIELLQGVWPDKSGRHYQSALRACDLACCLRGGLGSSRELFVAAALAAHVLEPQPIFGAVQDAAFAGSAPYLSDAESTALPKTGSSNARPTKPPLPNRSLSL